MVLHIGLQLLLSTPLYIALDNRLSDRTFTCFPVSIDEGKFFCVSYFLQYTNFQYLVFHKEEKFYFDSNAACVLSYCPQYVKSRLLKPFPPT